MRYRIEQDSMGEVKVPEDAYYGAQTQRARENFSILEQSLALATAFVPAIGYDRAASLAREAYKKTRPYGKWLWRKGCCLKGRSTGYWTKWWEKMKRVDTIAHAVPCAFDSGYINR